MMSRICQPWAGMLYQTDLPGWFLLITVFLGRKYVYCIHCMVVYCLVLSFAIPSVEGKGGAVIVWVIYFVSYSIYNPQNTDI